MNLTKRLLDPNDPQHFIYEGELPSERIFTADAFAALWDLRPKAFHPLMIAGRACESSCLQKAYFRPYVFAGGVLEADDTMPPLLAPVFEWCKQNIDDRLSGVMVNWYDAAEGHYIGCHHDSDSNKQILRDSFIVTITFLDSEDNRRIFRLTSWAGKKCIASRDFVPSNGTFYVMPWQTNLAWKHELVRPKKGDRGKRISVTLRSFI